MKVVRLGFTALKGTRHRALEAIDLDAEGAVGDRHFCLVAPSGDVLRTVQHPGLLTVRSAWDGARLSVMLPFGTSATGSPAPTGTSVTGDYWGRPVSLTILDGPQVALLSEVVGRPVRLASVPRGGVIYGDRVSLVSTATLRALAQHLGVAELDPARLRATVVVDAGDVPFVEDDWQGREVSLGAARIRVTARIPRCAVIDLDPTSGERDIPVLRALALLRPAGTPAALCAGVDARVTVPGPVGLGDDVSLV